MKVVDKSSDIVAKFRDTGKTTTKRRNKERITFRECLLSCSSEACVFPSAVYKSKNKNTGNYNFTALQKSEAKT
jgi:hypothetical protein